MKKLSVFVLLSAIVPPAPSAAASLRPCAVCGAFYSADADTLAAQAGGFIAGATATVKTEGEIVGVLAPHAGYEFSGKTAGEAFARIDSDYDTAVIIGTAHHAPVKAAALSDADFQTPLGAVSADAALIKKLAADKALFEISGEAHAKEHSVEVQLPFLQKKLKKPFKLVPVIMNTGDYETAAAAGRALGRALKGRKALIVISSDLSHYPSAATARRVDETALAAVETLDSGYFYLADRILLGHGEAGLECAACGAAAIIAGMEAVKELGANRAATVRYSNSGETGDPRRAVGYGALVFTKAKTPSKFEWKLNAADKKILLAAAREAVASRLTGARFGAVLSDSPELNLPAAVFVTITRDGNLRGCVGATGPRGTLYDSVAHFARAAAFEDGRFRPVEQSELEKLRYEIAILSVPEPVASPSAIKPKTHGVAISLDGRAGLFLPRVWDSLPDKAGFLSELCEQKAGLPRDCWKNPRAKLSVFTVYSFEDAK